MGTRGPAPAPLLFVDIDQRAPVVIDGSVTCVTPCSTRIEPGRHRLTLYGASTTEMVFRTKGDAWITGGAPWTGHEQPLVVSSAPPEDPEPDPHRLRARSIHYANALLDHTSHAGRTLELLLRTEQLVGEEDDEHRKGPWSELRARLRSSIKVLRAGRVPEGADARALADLLEAIDQLEDGRVEEAYGSFTRLHQLDSAYGAWAAIGMAVCLEAADEHEEARRVLDDTRRRCEDDPLLCHSSMDALWDEPFAEAPSGEGG